MQLIDALQDNDFLLYLVKCELKDRGYKNFTYRVVGMSLINSTSIELNIIVNNTNKNIYSIDTDILDLYDHYIINKTSIQTDLLFENFDLNVAKHRGRGVGGEDSVPLKAITSKSYIQKASTTQS